MLLFFFLVGRLALFARGTFLQRVGDFELALVDYRALLSRLREPTTDAGTAAWNSALIVENLADGKADGLRTSMEYLRLARSLYPEHKSRQECNSRLATLATQLLSIGLDAKAALVEVADRGARCCPLPSDPAVAAGIEEEWAHLDRLRQACNTERARDRLAERVLEMASHLIHLDPRGRYPTIHIFLSHFSIHFFSNFSIFVQRILVVRRAMYYVVKAEMLAALKRVGEQIETLRLALSLFSAAAFTSAVMSESRPGLELELGRALKAERRTTEAHAVFTEVIRQVDQSAAQGPTPFVILNELVRERALFGRSLMLMSEEYVPPPSGRRFCRFIRSIYSIDLFGFYLACACAQARGGSHAAGVAVPPFGRVLA